MSLFRPYIYKDRPDLQKDMPVKHGFFLFWELLARKFWRFLSVNLIYFFATLPMLAMAFIGLNNYLGTLVTDNTAEFFTGLGFYATAFGVFPINVFHALVVVSVVIYGPLTMGVTYIYRNFAREEHAWLSDIFSRGWANFKQGLFFGLLDVVVIVFLITTIFTDYKAVGLMHDLLLVAKAFALIALVLYCFMRHYFYMIAVTVNLSIWGILKNAWIFAVLGLSRNLLTALIVLAAWIVLLFINPIVTIVLLPTIFYAFTGFATVFMCYPVVKKFLILPILEKEHEGEAGGASELSEKAGGADDKK